MWLQSCVLIVVCLQFDRVMYWHSSGRRPDCTLTFELLLEASGDIAFQYADMCDMDMSWSTESIGFEDQTGSLGTQISYNEIPVRIVSETPQPDRRSRLTVSAYYCSKSPRHLGAHPTCMPGVWLRGATVRLRVAGVTGTRHRLHCLRRLPQPGRRRAPEPEP